MAILPTGFVSHGWGHLCPACAVSVCVPVHYLFVCVRIVCPPPQLESTTSCVVVGGQWEHGYASTRAYRSNIRLLNLHMLCSKIHYNTNMSDNYWWWWSICEGSTNILIYGRRQEDKETHKIRLQNRSLEFFRVPESVIAINFCLSYIIHPPPFRKCSM